MRIEDLRIGNFVKSGVNVTAITKLVLRPELVGTLESEISLRNVQPISLSSDWFLKLGFENRGDYFLLNGIKILEFNKHFQSGMWMFDFGVKGKVAIIKYVHQLQNLYFTLTGEELV